MYFFHKSRENGGFIKMFIFIRFLFWQMGDILLAIKKKRKKSECVRIALKSSSISLVTSGHMTKKVQIL